MKFGGDEFLKISLLIVNKLMIMNLSSTQVMTPQKRFLDFLIFVNMIRKNFWKFGEILVNIWANIRWDMSG